LLKNKRLNLGAGILIIMVLFAVWSGVMMTTYSSSVISNNDEIVTTRGEVTSELQEKSDLVMQIGKLTLTMCIIEPHGHLLVVYEMARQRATLEFMVEEKEEGYDTTIFLNGELVHQDILDGNLLEPISLASPLEVKQTASEKDMSPLSPQYTYRWWDGVKQVTGPSWQIKYHHPARDYYQIAPWEDWSKRGYQTFHNQINDWQSGVLSTAGWAGVAAAIGALIGEMWGGPAGAAGGAFIGAIIGVYLEAFTGHVLLDEDGCIWWWWGIEFNDWFWANWWWLATNPFGWGATMGGVPCHRLPTGVNCHTR